MASLSPTWCYQGGVLRHPTCSGGRPCTNNLQTSLLVSFSARHREHGSQENRRALLLPCLRCQKDDDEDHIRHISVERPPYNAYFDSSSGEMQPALGARHAMPPEICWPEGTKDSVRAAQAPKPTGDSTGSPSYGQQPGSRRKNYKASAAGSGSSGESYGSDDPEVVEIDEEEEATDETNDLSSDYVSYEIEPEEPTGYALDKKLGRPHPFIDPEKRRKVEGTLTNDELWWNWRKPKKEIWSRWQRRKPDVETAFLKAMVETGQVKIFGEEPTIAETALYRSRRHLYKQERLDAEQERLESIGPLAYYSEWVSAWKKDTSREAIQKHFEETGEDETTQLIEMFCHQTDREFRIMMGTDVRIKRDPLAMRMREDQIKQIWGGDPVYPTINYVQDPNEVADYRGPDFHEPTPNILDFLKEHGKIITREEIQKIIAEDEPEEVETPDTDEAMARAVDIGETEDEEEKAEVDTGVAAQDDVAVKEQEEHDETEVGLESELDEEEEEEGEDEKEEKVKKKKTTHDWSVQKTNPQTAKKKDKSKKGEMSLDQAIDDSENLTDFLMDFDEEEQ